MSFEALEFIDKELGMKDDFVGKIGKCQRCNTLMVYGDKLDDHFFECLINEIEIVFDNEWPPTPIKTKPSIVVSLSCVVCGATGCQDRTHVMDSTGFTRIAKK